MTGAIFHRKAARAIVTRDKSILLLFTERYNDFTFPGGGVADGEDLLACLCRDLAEETGAADVRVGDCLGYVEELRPYRRDGYELMQMTSHFYRCEIGLAQSATRMEDYEIANGMRPVWVDLDEALTHNQGVLRRAEPTMGLSIQRETMMLEYLVDWLAANDQP